MAVQATWTTQNYFTAASTLQKRQVIEILDVMSPREISFLQLIGTNGEAGKNPKLEWMNDALLAEASSVEDAAGINDSVTTINVPTGAGINFQIGNLLLCGTEYIYVTNVVTDALTVVRGVGGSSAAAHAHDAELKILSIANFESSARPKGGTVEPTFDYNYFQSFDTGFDMSFVSLNTDVYGQGPMREAREMARAIEQATIKLEKTAFEGVRADQSTTVTPRFMGGLSAFYTASTTGTHYGKDLGGQPLTEADIINALENRYYAVGSQNMAKTLIVGSWNARRISDIYAPSARMERNSRTGGVVVDTIDTQFGPVDVLLNLRCPKDRVYLVNVDFLKVHPYTGLSFADYELAVTGAQISRQIYGVYSLSARNIKSGGVIYNTATS